MEKRRKERKNKTFKKKRSDRESRPVELAVDVMTSLFFLASF
jgi:hypothetical protein